MDKATNWQHSAAEKLKYYALLVRLNRPIGILLLLWPTLWALWIAGNGAPDPWVTFVFIAGVVITRSAGCAINDYADRNIDRHVARTEKRVLTNGLITVAEAKGIFIVLAISGFALVLTLNWQTIVASLVALALMSIYPFVKRWSHLPQIVLGMAFGWSVPMAFLAQTGTLSPAAGLLFIATVFWTVAYDTIYAMVDRDDDLKIGVKSSAIFFGRYDRLAIGVMQLLTVVVLYFVGQQMQLGIGFNGCLMIATGFFLYEQWLIRHRERVACFKAFLHNQWFGLLVFVGLVLSYNVF